MFQNRIIHRLLVLGLLTFATSCTTTLTAEQEEILQGVGNWEGTITMFIPGQDAAASPATEQVQGLGSVGTTTRFSSKFMGQPYVGTGVVGYDPVTRCYRGTWTDNMSPYVSVMEGKKNPETNAVVMHWKSPNMEGVMTQQRSETVRTADSYTMTFYEGEGEGRKAMVIAMKRK